MTSQTLQLPGVKVLPPPLRRALKRQVLKVISHDGPSPDYDAPLGDPGLFGPDSVTWKIHADFPAMMAGGLASLMLQALHPLALAGVWDHSSFRDDTLGRLHRTIAFIGRTTYAPRAVAEAELAKVRKIHDHVHGTAADGRSYSANDPHLLTWVHCAEVTCFIHAYERYCQGPIPRAMQDQYLTEIATVAEHLGAQDVPKSVAELNTFFNDIQPELVFDERAQTVLRILDNIQLPIPMPGLGRQLFFGAGATLLPDWGLRLMRRTRTQRLRDRAAAGALKLIAPSIRDAMAPGGLGWRACRRVGADYERLYRWDPA